MAAILEKQWETALTEILAKLDDKEYDKMWEFVSKIPKQKKTKKLKREMPQKIIKQYGVNESIQRIKNAMNKIRKDPGVQDLLRPFVDQLKSKAEAEKKGTKRKLSETDSKAEDMKSEAGKSSAASDSLDVEQEAEGKNDGKLTAKDEPGRLPQKDRKSQSWRISIGELKASGNPGNKAIGGKIVQKSGLRTYQTRNKEKKFFFNLGVADETASIKVMVYGRERYQEIQEKSCYLFREVIVEGNDIKVTKLSKVSKTPQIDVPENLEMEARMLIDTQVCSIEQAKRSADKTLVSVEGKVTEIGSVENIKVKNRRGKKDKQDFKLEDDTGSIRITLWGEDIKHLRVSCGDVARVTNVKTSHFQDSVSLNSTDSTKILKVQSAAVQSVTIEIIGIIRASGTQTELEAELSHNNEVQQFEVASSLLAGALGVSLGGGFEDRLLDKMPFSADVEIKGNQIIKIKSVK
ncbi:uncharacterized protein LOC102299698 [Haplochromis burtoni]|uniref:uncharacterized protein LOC102299698 n=1 Tax=Haplochromis burtoni TaxID=8153 RepID=UPI0003BCEEDD|nr:uncharacterized protein LOC102299698 [Haplochromis burtoni]